jgi:hypothetical protein
MYLFSGMLQWANKQFNTYDLACEINTICGQNHNLTCI